jgi:putative membrane protein
MTQFQNAWNKASATLKADHPEMRNPENQQEPTDEDATMKVAGKLAETTGPEFSKEQKKRGGSIVHCGFGTAMGALYGLAMESPQLRKKQKFLLGAGFGTGSFLVADEIVVPALGLSGKASESPLGSHLYALASHLVYGVSAEAVRGLTRKFI